jgi:hypothetical protein
MAGAGHIEGVDEKEEKQKKAPPKKKKKRKKEKVKVIEVQSLNRADETSGSIKKQAGLNAEEQDLLGFATKLTNVALDISGGDNYNREIAEMSYVFVLLFHWNQAAVLARGMLE